MDLSKIKIGFSPLSGDLFIYRHGKDQHLALDKREAQRDVIAAVVEFMMHDAPEGASQVFHFGDKSYEITVKPKREAMPRRDDRELIREAAGQSCGSYRRERVKS